MNDYTLQDWHQDQYNEMADEAAQDAQTEQ